MRSGAGSLALALAVAAVSIAATPAIGDAYVSHSINTPNAAAGRALPNSRMPPVRRALPVPLRSTPYAGSKSETAKQPYPYRYYGDTSRGNTGCYWMAKRAIDTNNANWWQRYRACTETGAE
jgi:hypothetical protein